MGSLQHAMQHTCFLPANHKLWGQQRKRRTIVHTACTMLLYHTFHCTAVIACLTQHHGDVNVTSPADLFDQRLGVGPYMQKHGATTHTTQKRKGNEEIPTHAQELTCGSA